MADNYKYTQESAGSGKMNTDDFMDEFNLINEIRIILDDLATIVGHTKLGDGLYPKNALTGTIATNVVKNNFDAEATPTVNDDSGDGYAKGSIWTYDEEAFICVDATEGSAVWKEMSIPTGGFHLRADLIQKASKQLGSPDEIYRGCNVGYSFPIFDDDDEELYFRALIPTRWDGITNPQFEIVVTLMGAEDIGDKFKFQLEWQVTKGIGTVVMGETVSTCVSEQTIVTDGVAAYSAYRIIFTLDTDDGDNPIVAHDMLQIRIRRIAASEDEVDAEIGVWDWSTYWKADKAYETFQVHENVEEEIS